MMKKTMAALLAALMLPACALAADTMKLDGTMEAVRTHTIAAPHSGRVIDMTVRAGDVLDAGDALLALSAQKIYADFDGTITGVFAQPGDSAASVQERYGALCYVERDTLYTADCTTANAASENEYKIVHVGEKVYIRAKENDSRTGEAIVTNVEGKQYKLEVTAIDGLRVNENIQVFRNSRLQSANRIGEGTVRRVDPVGITAEGHVRAVHVQDGQRVKRGDLLMEIVPDALDGLRGGDGSVTMPKAGVVLSVPVQTGDEVTKDQTLATFCERRDMKLVCPADEQDLAAIRVGMEVQVTLDAYPDAPMTGTVEKIAGASAEGSSDATYEVTIRLPDNDLMRVGMNATAGF